MDVAYLTITHVFEITAHQVRGSNDKYITLRLPPRCFLEITMRYFSRYFGQTYLPMYKNARIVRTCMSTWSLTFYTGYHAIYRRGDRSLSEAVISIRNSL